MSAPNPSVSVFHFTSRISMAKIRKYKMATERGMGPVGNAHAPTPTSGASQLTPSPSVETSTMEPPAKRQKLKLNVRPPSDSPDTIAVSRPKRDSLRIRYSENMFIGHDDVEEISNPQKSKPSPAASSDLSSVPSVRSSEKAAAAAPSKAPSQKRDYSRDFMSYYVTGGDEEEEEEEEANQVVEAEPVPKVPDPPKQAPAPAPPVREVRSKGPRFKHHVQPSAYQVAKFQQPRMSLPQPRLEIRDSTRISTDLKQNVSVADMVKKLEALSAALTAFATVPAGSDPPKKQTAKEPAPTAPIPGDKKDVDDFLAMFDEGDSDEKDDKEDKDDDDAAGLNQLQSPGELDGPLSFGIQFIQNALRSWAGQRITMEHTKNVQQEQQLQLQQMQHESPMQKRGPGRPRKFDEEDPRSMIPQPNVHVVDVADTPEGAAIARFQDVLDSGCLRVNAVLPTELSTALRNLYMQIDRLINQGSRGEQKFHCMSYGAQIAAQKIRVEKWQNAKGKAQEEMARQQQMARQQMLQQMGIPQQQPGHMTVELAQHQHAVELERKRSLQHAAQQPHLSKYLTNPLHLSTQAAVLPAALPSAGSPGNGHFTSSTGAATTSSAPNISQGSPPQRSPVVANGVTVDSVTGKNVVLDRMKMYMPNFLPRSGQSMKFSFAPHSELALKTFGAQAFPTGHTGPNLPNRGPMSANPTLPSNHTQMLNRNIPTPVVPSNVSMPTPAVAKRSISGLDGATKDELRRVSTPSTANGFTNGNASTFTSINNASNGRRSNVPAASPNAASAHREVTRFMSGQAPRSPANPRTAPTVKDGKAMANAANHTSLSQHPAPIVLDE